MPFKHERLENGIIMTVISGLMTPAASIQSLFELAKLVQDNRLFELVLHEPDAFIDVNYQQSNQVAQVAKTIMGPMRFAAIAFVCPNDLLYGICRQMQIPLEADQLHVEVFRTQSEGMAWLKERLYEADTA